MAERKPLQDRVTDEARAGLHELALRLGCSRTALLEALGRHARHIKLPQRVVDEARRIDQQRRTR